MSAVGRSSELTIEVDWQLVQQALEQFQANIPAGLFNPSGYFQFPSTPSTKVFNTADLLVNTILVTANYTFLSKREKEYLLIKIQKLLLIHISTLTGNEATVTRGLNLICDKDGEQIKQLIFCINDQLDKITHVKGSGQINFHERLQVLYLTYAILLRQ